MSDLSNDGDHDHVDVILLLFMVDAIFQSSKTKPVIQVCELEHQP